MVGDNTKQRSPLLPDRMQQADFFVCDVFDAAPKGDMASMEHPIFSISTKPDRRIRRYESGSNFVEITPSMKGLATVHDRDVLIYCISQCMAALNEERPVSQTVRFKAYDLLTATNRGTDGRGYEQLRAALERLKGTAITTNIITGDMEVFDGFGLIDAFRIVRETRDGRMQEVEIRLSDWVFNAIQHKEVLTLHRDYFRLRKPLERRIYELARKHCGQKAEWKISLQKLQSKCGSSSTAKEFRRLVQKIVREDQAHGHMPDYAVRLENDMVMFANRRSQEPKPSPPALASIRLDPEAYHDARQVAPGWDIYVLEGEWRSWMAEMEKDKTTIIYNGNITMENVPLEAYDYVVNGKPALEWVMERQVVKQDKASGIVNDANDYANETVGNPRYPLDLFRRVITVSLETQKIVNSLPALDIDG